MAGEIPTIHASAVLVGAHAVLIRGPAGSGKSRLALELIEAGGDGRLPFTRLIGDDRVHVAPCHGRLIVRPAENLAGLIELRGVGIQRLPYEPAAVVGLVVDLAAEDAERMPDDARRKSEIAGVFLPRLAVAPGLPALPLLLTLQRTADGADRRHPQFSGPGSAGTGFEKVTIQT